MSYSYTKNPKRLREEARSFASDKKGPREVWSALKSWASDRGPVAVKAAVFEFLERYGTRPEAVPVFPEVLQQASEISPSLKGKERKHLVELADCASLTAKGGLALQPAINPKTDRLLNMPVSGSRPDPSLFFRPAETPKLPQLGNVGPLVPSSDINQLIKARDAMLHVNEKPYELPTPAKTPYKKKEHKQPPEIMSFSMPMGSSKSLKTGKKGEKLIRSLIEKMKEHAKEEHKTASPPRVERAEKTPEKAKPKRKRPKKAKTPKKEEIVKKAKPKPKRKKAKKRKAPKKVAPKKEEAPKKIKTKLRPRPKSKPKKKKPRKIKARPKKKRPKPKKKAIKKAKPKPRPKKKIVKRRAAKKKPKKTKAKPKPKPKKKPAKKKAKKKPKKKPPKKKAKKKTPKKSAKKKPKPKKKKKPAKKKKGKKK